MTTQPARWFVVTHDFPPEYTGGIASWAFDLALSLVDIGESVTVLARKPKGGGDAVHDQQLPFPVIRMAGRSWGKWQGTWAALQTLPRLRSGDRVICATWKLATGMKKWTRAKGARLGIAFHGSDLTQVEAPCQALVDVCHQADALLPVSQFLSSELVRLGVEQSATTLPMPLRWAAQPYTDSLIDPADRSGLITVARLTALKGIDRSIAIAAQLKEPISIVGDGPAQTDLIEQATTESGEDAAPVSFTGRLSRQQTTLAMAKAKALLLLPRTLPSGRGAEGLGLVLLEAAALGIPVVGCNTGGVPEAVGPGLLLESPDSPNIPRIEAFINDPDAGVRGQRWVQRHHGPTPCIDALRRALP